MRRVLLLLAAIALAGCGSVVPSPSPSTAAVVQRHACGNLAADVCGDAIAAVIRQVPGQADSPVAVAATLDPNRPSQRGGDWVVVVSFAPFGDEDIWMNPPTWVVTQTMLSSNWTIEPWRTGTLPPRFVELLRSAGIKE